MRQLAGAFRISRQGQARLFDRVRSFADSFRKPIHQGIFAMRLRDFHMLIISALALVTHARAQFPNIASLKGEATEAVLILEDHPGSALVRHV
jgi:hypothetical protein